MSNIKDIIIKKYLSGVKIGAIFREIKHLGTSRSFVYRAVTTWKKLQAGIKLKKRGRKCTVATQENIKLIRERVRRNCERSARQTAKDLEINRETVRLILHNNLNMKPYKKRKIHGITAAAREKRKKRSQHLLSWHAESEIIFSDEKLFVLEEKFNVQNDRLWAVGIEDIPKDKRNIPRYQNASAVMVWGAVSRSHKFDLVFIERNVKINSNYYLDVVLQKNLLPELKRVYKNEYYCFQQDGAPSHTAKIVQEWCSMNFADFISKDEWPPSSPDLNPLDFSIWGYMLGKLKNYKYNTLEQFKCVINEIWQNIPMDVVRAACNGFNSRLRQVIRANGNTIE